ncbi:SLC13 family permease [Candidatus Binatus sp.]|uniref:SLC13 family permease n=1 Tax=Candidatus Binatus sp. TaxID=2811406 RepID=UPI002F939D69
MLPSHTPALAIFALTYAVIALGEIPWLRIDRTGAALAGAVAMVVSGALSGAAAERAIDFHTIALLLGMMIVVANLRLSGAFAFFARGLLSRARSGFGMLAMTVAAAGLLAAFFINDVVCLALTPLIIDAAEIADLDPIPLLLGLATASNIGSAATITGNPQNMIVAGFAHLGYSSFAFHLAPAAIIGLVIDFLVIAAVYRKSIGAPRRPSDAPAPRTLRVNRPLMIKSSIVALGALAMFVAGYPTHLVAMSAGVILLFTRRIKPHRVYRLIDWTMLAMFTGLFIVVAGFETTGFQTEVLSLVGVQRLTHPVTLTVVVAILSNLVSNVPAVLLFRPLYPMLGGGRTLALLIASASTYAGNLTLVGSIANLIVVEQARLRRIDVTFVDYLRVGVPITLITLAINTAFLALWP